MSTPQGIQPLPPPQLQQVSEELFRIYFSLLLSDRMADRTVSSSEPGTIDISDQAGNSVRLIIDGKTGLPAKEVYESRQPTGQPGSMEEVFDEFEQAGGIKVPKKITVNQAGKTFAEMTITEYKINSGIKNEDISKKP